MQNESFEPARGHWMIILVKDAENLYAAKAFPIFTKVTMPDLQALSTLSAMTFSAVSSNVIFFIMQLYPLQEFV